MPSSTALAGAATAAFSAVFVAAPGLLLRPCGIAETRQTRALARMVGARDVVLGLAMVAAAPGPAGRLAVAGRVGADCTDAAALAAGLARQGRRGLVSASAVGWAPVCLGAGVLDERAGR